MLKNIVDGFLDNPTIRYLPSWAPPLQLGQMEAIRRAHNLRDHQLVLPNRITDPIAARGQLSQEIRVTPCSYLWAVSFWEFETPEEEAPETIGAGVAPDHFSLQITDEESGAEIASEFISARAFWPGFPGTNRLKLPYTLLDQPRLFAGRGLISIRIANTDSVPHFCQLVCYFVEPCDGPIAPQQCP